MNKSVVIASLLTVVLASACTTQDAYTGEQKSSNATKGAVVGAIAGAAVGAATAGKKDRDKSILTGAAAGAAVGGGVGYYMDKQEEKLRARLQGTGVQVKRDGNKLTLIMPGNITFDTGKSRIKSSFIPVLNSVADVLKEFKKTIIKVDGHTDSVGDAQYNQELSESRAAAVADYLISRQVARGRVHTAGFGERYPIASNATAAGREQNRRVELSLEPSE